MFVVLKNFAPYVQLVNQAYLFRVTQVEILEPSEYQSTESNQCCL